MDCHIIFYNYKVLDPYKKGGSNRSEPTKKPRTKPKEIQQPKKTIKNMATHQKEPPTNHQATKAKDNQVMGTTTTEAEQPINSTNKLKKRNTQTAERAPRPQPKTKKAPSTHNQ